MPTSSNAFGGGISQTELEDLRHAFQLFDTEKKGKILLKDVRTVLESISFQSTSNSSSQERTIGGSSSASGLHRVLSRISSLTDKDDSTELSMPEFISLMMQPDPHDKRSEMRKVFDLFDVDRKGYISCEDLGRVAADLGEVMDRQELQEMIQRASSSSSASSSSMGKVYPQDFEAIMSRRLFS
jgi:Ca2+-binding EF-hand superfamily protein